MMMFLRARLIFTLLFAGLGLMYYGYTEFKESAHMKERAEYIPCSKFERSGPARRQLSRRIECVQNDE